LRNFIWNIQCLKFIIKIISLLRFLNCMYLLNTRHLVCICRRVYRLFEYLNEIIFNISFTVIEFENILYVPLLCFIIHSWILLVTDTQMYRFRTKQETVVPETRFSIERKNGEYFRKWTVGKGASLCKMHETVGGLI
jgi:hypothetical protein